MNKTSDTILVRWNTSWILPIWPCCTLIVSSAEILWTCCSHCPTIVAGTPVQIPAEFLTVIWNLFFLRHFRGMLTFQSVVPGPALSQGTGTPPAWVRRRTGQQHAAELHLHRGSNVRVCNTRPDIPCVELWHAACRQSYTCTCLVSTPQTFKTVLTTGIAGVIKPENSLGK